MIKQVLIVEDVDDVLFMMKFWVESFQYEVVTATNGKEAVEIFKEKRPDLILMDLMMPMMDGISATENIRRIDREIPIVVLTAYHDHYQQKAIEAGASTIVQKPVDFDKLQTVLNKYLS